MTLELRMWHVLVLAVVAVATLGLASGKFFFSTTTTKEVVRTVTVEDPAAGELLRGFQQGFQERAEENAVQADVRAGIPAVEAYFSDNIGGTAETEAGFADDNATTTGYEGMTVEKLLQIDSSMSENFEVVEATADSYCVEASSGSAVASKAGPAAEIVLAPC